MKNNENTHFIDKVVDTLRKAAIEIEEFQVKASLGKAEALDKYDQIKKKFNLFIHDTNYKLKKGKEKVDDIAVKLEELRVQLALGKAETTEAFKEQKKQLRLKLHELEVAIKTNKTLNRLNAFMLIEIEKFKVQLDVLEQKIEKGKAETKESFKERKQDFNKLVEGIKEKYTKKEETKWEHFQAEISEAFDHFKQAFTKA